MNIKTLAPQLINEMREDERLVKMFENMYVGRIFDKEYVDRRVISVEIESLESRLPNASGQRSALVAYNSPTPKGGYDFGYTSLQLNDFRFAYPLGQTVFGSASQMLSYVENVLFNKAGMQVKMEIENQLVQIAKGTATGPLTSATAKALANDQRWDSYAAANHDPVADLIALQQATGSNNLIISRDVANALRSSPVLTGSSAGGGVEYLTDDELLAKLAGLGFWNVYITGFDPVNLRAYRLPALIGSLYTGMAMMWADGAIKEYILEGQEFYFDQFSDPDRKTDYLRAQETSRLAVLYPDQVGYFTNILTP